MPEARVPGIYVAEQQYTLNPLRIDTRCLTAFAGIAEKGPLHEPALIKSFDEYLRLFGSFDTAGVMPFSVYSYFKCGGAECVVVRVANEEAAKRATLSLKCASGSISFEAKSVGNWGNYVTCRVWHEGEKLESPESVDTRAGEWIGLDGADVRAGDILRVSLLGQRVNRTVRKVEDGRVYLEKPLKLLARAREPNREISVEKAFFSVALSCKGKSETYVHLSMNPSSDRYFLPFINKRSLLCSVTASENPGMVQCVFSANASGGSDGIAELGAGDFIGYYGGPGLYKGIGAFESVEDVSLIAVPDASWILSQAGKTKEARELEYFAVQNALVSQAERFPGRFAVLDVPPGFDAARARAWANKIDSSCAAAYYPSIDVIDPTDRAGCKTARVPPSGAVCGCIVATDGEKGIFHAPANVTIQGAVGVSERVGDAEYEALYAEGINLLKYFPGKGIKIWGARTLASDPDWRYINVRRTFSRIASSIKRGTQWAVFEPNTANLRKRLVRQVSGFLLDLWMKGYLSGSTAEQGFFVRCDDELNPPDNIDNGLLTFEVGIAVIKPAEFFSIVITAEKEGASVYIQDE